MHKFDKEIRAFLDGKMVETDRGSDNWALVNHIRAFTNEDWQFRIRPTKREGWINIAIGENMPCGSVDRGAIYFTKGEAVKWCPPVWKTIRIEWEE